MAPLVKLNNVGSSIGFSFLKISSHTFLAQTTDSYYYAALLMMHKIYEIIHDVFKSKIDTAKLVIKNPIT